MQRGGEELPEYPDSALEADEIHLGAVVIPTGGPPKQLRAAAYPNPAMGAPYLTDHPVPGIPQHHPMMQTHASAI